MIFTVNSDFEKLYGISEYDYFSKMPLTFEALADCTFTFYYPNDIGTSDSPILTHISYSVDNGETWVTEEFEPETEKTVTTPLIKTGETVLWKADGCTYDWIDDDYGYFSSDEEYNVYGNIMSLIYEDDFADKDTLLEGHTFSRLFEENNIVSAENLVLPATTLTQNCYIGMFSDCVPLTSAPTLPATTLTVGCYESMFSACGRLNSVKMLATDISATNCLYNWISSASTGTLIINKDYEGLRRALNVPATWTILNEDGTPHIFPRDYSEEYFTIEVMNNNTAFNFTIPIEICENDDITEISYSIDNGNTWTTINEDDDEISIGVQLNAGEKILLKGIANKYSGILSPEQDESPEEFYSNIYVDDDYIVYGNIMSLFYGDNFLNKTLNTNYTYHCAGLFKDNDCLIDASNLIFPTNILAGSYLSMFQNCTSLTTAPSILPAKILAKYCYFHMFNGCTSLTTAPVLPSTSLVKQCYYSMFSGCTSLTTAPELPATTLVSGCYNYMFSGCTNLNYIKAMFTTAPGGSYTASWVSNVAQQGTFVKNKDAEWSATTGASTIPTGWTVETA